MNLKRFEKLVELRRTIGSKRCSVVKLKALAKEYAPRPLDEQLKKEVKRVWGDVSVNPKWIDWYRAHCGVEPCNAAYFLPEGLYYGVIDLFYNNYTASKFIDNKNDYDTLFHDVNRPETVVHKVRGFLLDADCRIISREQCTDIVARLDDGVILKPAILSCGGHGISIFRKGEPAERFMELLDKGGSDVIVQKLIHQHPTLANLHPSSVNTIRIITWLRACGEVVVLNAIVRMGIGGKVVDNASSGGIFCGIDSEGRLRQRAFNTHGKAFNSHPDGATFEGVSIPNFEGCCRLVKRLAPRVATVSRLVSWDLSVGEDGEPILVEANLSCGELDFHQITGGPLFGEYTPEMIAEVFSSRRNVRLSKIMRF